MSSQSVPHPPRAGSRILVLAAFSALLPFLLRGTLPAQDAVPVQTFQTGSQEHVTGMCFQGGVLYAATKSNSVLSYDPLTGQSLGEHSPLITTWPHVHIHGMCAGAGGTFWVYDMISARHYQFDFATYTELTTLVPPGPMPYGLTHRGGVLWFGHHSEGPPTPIHAMDATSGAVLGSWSPGVADVHGLAWVGEQLFVLDNTTDELVLVDRSGVERSVTSLPGRDWDCMAYDGRRLWLSAMGLFYVLDLPLLAQDPLAGGRPARLVLANAEPGDTFFWLASLSGSTPAALPTVGGLDRHLLAPLLDLGTTGAPELVLPLPPVLPPAIDVWTQVLVHRPSASPVWHLSNVVHSLTP